MQSPRTCLGNWTKTHLNKNLWEERAYPLGELFTESMLLNKKIYICFYNSILHVDTDINKLRKILKEMGIPDHLTCLLRNLYAGQELDMEQQTGSK